MDKNVLSPSFKTLDRIVLGIEESDETENHAEFMDLDTGEEFDVKRSIN